MNIKVELDSKVLKMKKYIHWVEPLEFSRLRFLLLAILLANFAINTGETSANPPQQRSHPFLLITESDFAGMQERASQWPWSVMRDKALADFTTHADWQYQKGKEMRMNAVKMGPIASTAALLYIIDPENRDTYRNRLVEILPWWNEIAEESKPGSWPNQVWTGVAFYNSVLAYDIIYSDLDENSRLGIEPGMDAMAGHFAKHDKGWRDNAIAAYGIWAIFKNDRPMIDKAVAAHRKTFEEQIGPDGVFRGSNMYANARFNGFRVTKSNFMDVIERAGEDNFSKDPRLALFYEWLYGYSTTPFHRYWSFGQSPIGVDPRDNVTRGMDWSGAELQALKLSDIAGGHAAWRSAPSLEDKSFPYHGRLIAYVRMEKPFAKPLPPSSRIFPAGGAWIYPTSVEPFSFAAALWNTAASVDSTPEEVAAFARDPHQMRPEYMPDGTRMEHSQKHTNALHLVQWGEHLLVNSPENFTPTIENNTVSIDGRDHRWMAGFGISEGLVGNAEIEYASGSSGWALHGGHHQRSVIVLHGMENRPTQVLIVDEVQADSLDSNKMHTSWHPLSAKNMENPYSIIEAGDQYRWQVAPANTDKQAWLDFFFVTRPSEIDFFRQGSAHVAIARGMRERVGVKIALRSVSLWVKPKRFVGYQTLYDEGNFAGGFAIRLNGANVEAGVHRGGSGREASIVSLPWNTEANGWAHITATFDGDSGALTLSVNGEKASEQTDLKDFDSRDEFGIGGSVQTDIFQRGSLVGTDMYTDYLTGLIYDVQVYDVALNETQIAEIQSNFETSLEPKPVARWKFDGDAMDLVGGGKLELRNKAEFINNSPKEGSSSLQLNGTGREFLHARYELDENGRGQSLTILTPLATEIAPAMKRIEGENFHGVKISYADGGIDTAMIGDGSGVARDEEVAFQGLAAVHRRTDDGTIFYLVRQGRSFDDRSSGQKRGFESAVPFTVYFAGEKGKVVSPGADLTLFSPGITGANLNGKPAKIKEKGADFVKIEVLRGTWDLEIKN